MVKETDVLSRLGDARRIAQAELEAAMNSGRMDDVIKYARIIKDGDEALQMVNLAAERVEARLKSGTVKESISSSPNLTNVTASPSKKAQGKAARDKYVRALATKGIHLRSLKGRLFQNEAGKRVGIAYASERQPDKWWMGLPDDHYDVLVFLCETTSDGMLDFVLPPEFVKKVWNHLTPSRGQREWHVQRNGVGYELEPRKNLGSITGYLSKLDSLN